MRSRAGKANRRSAAGTRAKAGPAYEAAMEDALGRLGFGDASSKRMFGGLCYYAAGRPFAFVIGDMLAVKLARREIGAAVGRGEGRPFEPKDGFIMREYLALSESVLERDGPLDAYVAASYGFVSGRRRGAEDLPGGELRRGRRQLYRIREGPGGVLLPEE